MTVFVINALLVVGFFFLLFCLVVWWWVFFFSFSQIKSKSNTVILIAYEKGSIYKRHFSLWVVGGGCWVFLNLH